MGILFPDTKAGLFILYSEFFFYGNAASETLVLQVANDIATYWNEPEYFLHGVLLRFLIKGHYAPQLQPQEVWYNTNPACNYYRIEEYCNLDISFTDGLGSNTGYFKLDNLLHTGSTAAHEYGHSLGLDHPGELDIRSDLPAHFAPNHGPAQTLSPPPGIMYPRGTLVDAYYQYAPDVPAGQKGGTLNPAYRRVSYTDIASLRLERFRPSANSPAVIGEFTSLWHEAHLPPPLQA
jgi:hypothetical protein